MIDKILFKIYKVQLQLMELINKNEIFGVFVAIVTGILSGILLEKILKSI